jgi:hypothetical protein
MYWESVDFVHLAEGSDQWRALVIAIAIISIP